MTTHRAAGVLLGQACGDALGVPYEFGVARLGAHPQMLGGGLGDYAPGEWSDDTQMAAVIAQVSATGAELTSEDALDEIAGGFLRWRREGATDIGNQTARVLRAADRGDGPAGRRLTEAAAADARHNRKSAGNGALMRTSIIGLTRVDDRDATAAAARAVAALTHVDDDVSDSCVLWTEAIRHAVVDHDLDLLGGLDLLPPGRRGRWQQLIMDAEQRPASTFTPNGWTVTALQAAWSAIVQKRPNDRQDPAHLELALEAAIRIGDDTDTVAAIAGGLLGAYWGASAIPARWQRVLHGWPGLRAHDLLGLAVLTARGGRPDPQGWPSAHTVDYGGPQRQRAVPHPHDPGVILGTIDDLGHVGDAVISLCRLGSDQIPATGIAPADHLQLWLIDADDETLNPHLSYVLRDVARTIASLRAEGKTVLVHCVAAQQRTPSAALAYARLLGVPPDQARKDIRAALKSARGHGALWERAAAVQPEPT